MKTILVISLLLIGQLSFAQNYHPIKINQESHFGWSTGTIYSIRIDSIENTGSDIIYYNHKILGHSHNTIPHCDYMLLDSSWIGRKIIEKNNGDFVFINGDFDSIKIKSAANLNDSWILYTYSNKNYVEATVSQIGIQSFLNIQDSVKTISLQVKDSSHNLLTATPFSSINALSIKLSKNHGFTKPIYIIDFPSVQASPNLIGQSSTNTGINNLTAAEIYNFDVGDEFHITDYYRSDWNPSVFQFDNIRKKVLTKYISSNQDTLQYTFDECITSIFSTTGATIDTNYTNDTLIETYILSELNYLNQLSHEMIADSSTYSLFQINNTFNLREKKRYNYIAYPAYLCWTEVVGNIPTYSSYLDGLGGPYYNNDHLFIGTDLYMLQAYKKNGQTWGNPFTCNPLGTSVATTDSKQPNISVFPNPFLAKTTISIGNNGTNPWQLNITDINGRVLLTKEIIGDSYILEEQLAAGIYFYQISHQGKQYTGKIIAQ